MARMNITLPAMGEGVIEATISKWLVKEGEEVKEDDPIVEVATDKVDSEVPAPVSGTIVSIALPEGSLAEVGETIAVIETEIALTADHPEKVEKEVERVRETIDSVRKEEKEVETLSGEMKSRTPSGKFISPLVRSIAAREGISYADLDKVTGTGMDGRITKDDILKILEERKKAAELAEKAETQEDEALKTKALKTESQKTETQKAEAQKSEAQKSDVQKSDAQKSDAQKPDAQKPDAGKSTPLTPGEGDVVIEMDRVRKLIAEHMVMSKRTSPHVTSFIDADVTRLVNWRNSVKDKYLAAEGQKLTLTPIFIDATSRALSDFPMINVSVDGNNIIVKKNINIGMATALPDGNLIVPVIKNANEKNLKGLAKAVNDLADRARNNKLKPDEITGGTFTLTNFGSYNNLTGTPIINQPQSAILGTGAVRKMPAVIETPDGDVIAIRQIMILALTYDHRVIDGALAGKFLGRLKEILENYSADQ
ncbi:MAG: 2-oxo acid dehydrogenase subunit E2 [Bacteroidales bacterium]